VSCRRTFRFIAAAALVAVAVPLSTLAAADIVAPLPPGPFAVACSNVAQDFSRVPAGDSAQDYWEGQPNDNGPRYITDLLSEPANAVIVDLHIPDDGGLFGNYAGQTSVMAVLVCYPTAADNPRADYPLPTGNAVPHMQRGNDAPIFPAADARYPVLLFSTGLTGSPISGDYVAALRLFASWGYVVVAPFPGDPRFANVKLENFGDYLYAAAHLKDFVAMQAVRPLALSLALDAVLASPQFAGHVEPSMVGGFGASLGGESLVLMGGAQLTTTIGLSSKRVTLDARLKAAVGYVPFFGQPIYPAFGRDQKGLTGVTLPLLAISGTADTTAPLGATEDGFDVLTGTRQLVALTGVEHGFDQASSDDIFTWSLYFLAGQLSDSEVGRATSARMSGVAGGGDDVELVDQMLPLAAVAGERIVVEYYAGALDHYFLTAEPAEAALLDAGVVVPGWQRTGYDFKARPPGDARGAPACRFFGTPGIGPDSHFYTIDANECAVVRASPYWTFESIAFSAEAPAAGVCPPNRIPVTRLFNNGMRGQASHRFVASRSEVRAMQQRGLMVEGAVFCAIP
jgi:predicted dienelactone hydrolase